MKSLSNYIYEVSRDTVYNAYQKASGAQKNRILKTYHELYDKDDDLIIKDTKVIDIFKELCSITYDYCKAIDTTFKKEKRKHKNDAMPYEICCFFGGTKYSGYKTFGAEPERDGSPIMLGLEYSNDRNAMNDAMRSITEKCKLRKRLKDLADTYPDYLKFFETTGEATWYTDVLFGINFKKEIPTITTLKNDERNINVILTNFYFVEAHNRCGLYAASTDGKNTYYSCWNNILAEYYNKYANK